MSADRIATLLAPIQNRLNAANDYPGPVTIAESQEDVACLFAAVRAISDLADAWQTRGERLIQAASEGPNDIIAEALSDDGYDFMHRAGLIRSAVMDALGGEPR